MKLCPHCHREIQDEAIKCRWCRKYFANSELRAAQEANRPDDKPWTIRGVLVTVVGIAVLLFLIFCVVGNTRKSMPRDRLATVVIGKTQSQVMENVGKPDQTDCTSPEQTSVCSYYYKNKTYDSISGTDDLMLQVIFERGIASKINF